MGQSPPALEGFKTDYFSRTLGCAQEGLRTQVCSGLSFGLWDIREPCKIRVSALGRLRFDASSPLVVPSTPFDLSSMTKSLFTSVLTSLLVERGWIHWEDPVVKFFPDFPYPEIRLRHLLAHAAGYEAWRPLYETLQKKFGKNLPSTSVRERQKEMRKAVFSVAPEKDVGERHLYSDFSFLILGFCLEEILGLPLDRAFTTHLIQPLSVDCFSRRVVRGSQSDLQAHVAATENSEWRGGILQGQVHDDNCWSMGGYSGHAGAFGSAPDVLKIVSSLFAGFLSPTTLQKIWSRRDAPSGPPRTWGWDVPAPTDSALGQVFSRDSVGHLGYTGTSVWIDLENGLAVTLLTNRVHPTRGNEKIKAFRQGFHDALGADLVTLGRIRR